MQSGPSLQLKQSNHLVMTQQLRQSIKMLRLSSLELKEFVALECETNPFLLSDEPEADAPADVIETTESSESQEDAAPESSAPDEPAAPEVDGDSFDATGAYDYNPSERITIVARNKDGDVFEDEDAQEKDITLREHLLDQLNMAVHDPIYKAIGERLIDAVDEAGYIKEDLTELAEQLGTSRKMVEDVLNTLQTFDPVGVCARNLEECLSLQLAEQNRLDPAMQTMLANLELIGKGEMLQLQRKCGVDEDDFKQMLVEIRALNPKPGLAFGPALVQTVEPDIIVRRDNAGAWRVELVSSAMPRVLVNRQYIAEIAPKAQGEDKKFITENIGNANWLVKALDQRANTILKVATDIVAEQEGFFRLGIHYLKPLTLKDIAAATGFHESTVSRVTTNKYMMTPRGLFELKYFFTSSVSHARGGDDVSSETVKHMLRELIESEDVAQPLSDDDIAEKIGARGVKVARRTVAKYREALHIPSSTHRRRLNVARG
jgi:RNA polymerase sigma-54 factor